MKIEEIAKNYFYHLEHGDYPEIIALFSNNAVITSPLYGLKSPTDFYQELFKDTNQSKITLKDTFISAHNHNTAAVHFTYEWTMKNGSVSSFECVDVFELDKASKITKLTIIYDTYQTRIKFDKLKI